MYNLDSLSLKFWAEENENFLKNAAVQKIQMLSKREILLSVRNLGVNKKLYINLNPKYPHLNFISDKENYEINTQKAPPMFCMLLRKYLESAKIKEFRLVGYERILEFYFTSYDEIGSETLMCLAIELMGKYSNAILYNASNKVIAGSLHNISPEKSSVREIWGGVKYIYPPKQDKKDILKISAADYFGLDKENFLTALCGRYYYLSKGFADFAFKKSGLNYEVLFTYLQNAIANDSGPVKEFWLKNILDEGLNPPGEPFSVDALIEKYFSHFVMKDMVETRKNALRKRVLKEISRCEKIIENSSKKASYQGFKEKGELILANIYKLKKGDKKLTAERFSDARTVEILLDTEKTPSENAQHYFALYNKAKTAEGVLKARCAKAKEDLEYLNDILFSIENADRPRVLDEIKEETDEFFNPKNIAPKAKKQNINVETIVYQGFTLYLGKNNKQNDFIIKKLSNPDDIWLHAFNCPSSHCVIKTENGRKAPSDAVLEYAAKLVKANSPMKESAKASIIYTKRKYLKRPPDTHLGYVTYRAEKEIVV